MPKAVKPWHPVIGSGSSEFFLGLGDALCAGASDEEIFGVAELAHLADLFALLVVDADFAPDIAWVFAVEHDDRASLGEGVFDLVAAEIAFVAKRHDEGVGVY